MNPVCLGIVSLSVLGLASCGNTTTSTSTTELEGTWSNTCSGSGTSYNKTVVKATGTTLVQTYTQYSDSSCLVSSQISESTVTFSLGDAVTSPSGAKKIDSTYSKVTITATTSLSAAALNALSYCGFTDWAANTAKDVSGKTCSTTVMPSSGQKSYSLYTLTTSVTPNTLAFGTNASTTDDGTTDAKRNTAISTTTFSKQ